MSGLVRFRAASPAGATPEGARAGQGVLRRGGAGRWEMGLCRLRTVRLRLRRLERLLRSSWPGLPAWRLPRPV